MLKFCKYDPESLPFGVNLYFLNSSAMYNDDLLSPKEPVKRPSNISLARYEISAFILAVTSSSFCPISWVKERHMINTSSKRIAKFFAKILFFDKTRSASRAEFTLLKFQ